MDNRARGPGGRRSLLHNALRLPKATQSRPGPLDGGLSRHDEQTTEATSAPVVVAAGDEQVTDLTGRPGTPSAVRRRVEARAKGPRSLLGPDAYHVGDGIHPRNTDVVDLMDAADRPTDHGDPEDILARIVEMRAAAGLPPIAPVEAPRAAPPEAPIPATLGGALGLSAWDDGEPDPTPVGAPSRTRTDPFGLHLPTDEVDMLARSGGTFPEAFERSFFERETQPIPRGTASMFVPPSNTAAAIAVIAFGLVAVVSLTLSAWIALSTPSAATSAVGSETTLPVTPSGPAPIRGAPLTTPPPPPPGRDAPADATPPEPTIADLPT